MTTRPDSISTLKTARTKGGTTSRRSPSAGNGSFHSFLGDQIRALEAFDYVLVSPAASPATLFEVLREEDGNLRIRHVTERPEALSELQRASFGLLGFQPVTTTETGTAWERLVAGPESDRAAQVVGSALADVFGIAPGVPVDLAHGNVRARIEARRKLEAVRIRVESLLTELLGHTPTRDADGDWVFPYESSQVFVSPRVSGGMVVVRVFAITNAGLAITPQLSLFIANLNFSLTFCRFALDLQHGAVWVDEALLGDEVTDEELRFTVKVVAQTAADWETRIQQMFGGFTARDVLSGRSGETGPPTKPGYGGYL